MTITLDLSPQEEEQLHQLAAQQGISAEELVLQAIRRLLARPQMAGEEVTPANAEPFSHTSSLDYATGLDNAQIDADLIRENDDNYADSSQVVVLGKEGCHAGIFIYKDDSRVQEALQSLQAITRRQMVRGELHRTKEGFICGIRKWNSRFEDDNAYLCVHAHMGSRGINRGTLGASLEAKNASQITWKELAENMPNKFEMLWLLGCASDAVLEKWKDSCPTKYLFVTSESKNYVDFLRLFAAEITFDSITLMTRCRCTSLHIVLTLRSTPSITCLLIRGTSKCSQPKIAPPSDIAGAFVCVRKALRSLLCRPCTFA